MLHVFSVTCFYAWHISLIDLFVLIHAVGYLYFRGLVFPCINMLWLVNDIWLTHQENRFGEGHWLSSLAGASNSGWGWKSHLDPSHLLPGQLEVLHPFSLTQTMQVLVHCGGDPHKHREREACSSGAMNSSQPGCHRWIAKIPWGESRRDKTFFHENIWLEMEYWISWDYYIAKKKSYNLK